MNNINIIDETNNNSINFFDYIDEKSIEKLKQVDTLVFQGGGVRGLAYLGAMHAVDHCFKKKYNKDFLKGIVNVAGTSAGSITAFLLALGFDMNKIDTKMKSTDFGSFVDTPHFKSNYVGGLVRGLFKGYICDGDAFSEWIKDILEESKFEKEINFEQLLKKTGKNLMVFSVRVNDNKIVQFSPSTTPKVPVWLAVRMSMSIPIFFRPVRVDQKIEGNSLMVIPNEKDGAAYFVDGGTKANYPWSQVFKNMESSKILGFRLMTAREDDIFNKIGISLPSITLGNIKNSFTYSLQDTLFSLQDELFFSNTKEGDIMKSRTIKIFDELVSTFDFNMNESKKNLLINSGLKSVVKFFGPVKNFPEKIKFAKVLSLEQLKEKVIPVMNKIISISKDKSTINIPSNLKSIQNLKDFVVSLSNEQNGFDDTRRDYLSEEVSKIDNITKDLKIFLERALQEEDKKRKTIFLKVLRANNLPNKDIGLKNFSDPFCILMIDGYSKQTKVVKDNLNPIWDESFIFEKVKENAVLVISVHDSDIFGNESLGLLEVPIKDLKPLVENTFNLKESNKNSTISLKITYELTLPKL